MNTCEYWGIREPEWVVFEGGWYSC